MAIYSSLRQRGGAARTAGELQNELSDLLHDAPYLSLRDCRCEYSQGTVVLHGRVPNFFLKQVAQTLMMQAGEVREVINCIEVA